MSAPTQFRKKPVVISAIQWTGENLVDVIHFTDGRPPNNKSSHAGMMWDQYVDLVRVDGLKIFTMEGKMDAAIGDWIIKGVKGEHYPCKPEIFALTYEDANARTDLSQAAVAAALEAAAQTLNDMLGNTLMTPDQVNAVRGAVLRIRAMITPAQHDALAAHVAAEVAKARAEWVGSHCKELTAADRAYLIAHLSYELEPVGKPPTWNQLAMEVVRLSNALAKIGAKP